MLAEKLSSLSNSNQLILTEEEQKELIGFFEFLEDDEKNLQSYNTDNVERMVHCLPIENILREDVQKKLFSREDLLRGAPEQSNGYWQVPRLLE